MPPRTPRPCRHNGCSCLTTERNGFCEQHRNTKWEVYQAGKSTTERGYGADWQKITRFIKRRDKGLCQEHLRNGFVVVGVDVDHIKAKAHGGTDEYSNLELLCKACHRKKTANE